jgi:hypothetical protein
MLHSGSNRKVRDRERIIRKTEGERILNRKQMLIHDAVGLK